MMARRFPSYEILSRSMSTWTKFSRPWRNAMSNRLPLNPALRDLPIYQPGRPIEEVARELRMDPGAVIKLASNENPLGPSPAAVAAMEKALQTLHLYPDGNAYYLKQA